VCVRACVRACVHACMCLDIASFLCHCVSHDCELDHDAVLKY